MDTKDTITTPIKDARLIGNSDYYKFIFKKTEKIVSAVLFILHDAEPSHSSRGLVEDIRQVSVETLRAALRTLSFFEWERGQAAQTMGQTLVALEAHLRVAVAVRLMSEEHRTIFSHEIESIYRMLRTYGEAFHLTHETEVAPKTRTTRSRAHTPYVAGANNAESGAVAGQSSTMLSREERILNVIKEKGQASIKDISEQVTDCSEKTIQRELISLMGTGRIVRYGERRWSRYSVA